MNFLHALLAQVNGGVPNPILPWIGASGMTGLLGVLYWQERNDRKSAEERERATYKEYSDRISSEVIALKQTGELVLDMQKRIVP